ncbi:hypothetical protein AB432_022395 [Brevibacillus brevis]|uniref:Transposase n=1 Tax=Brevibacillus brevis TaxID=1393 RepID=A0A2Z4MMG8_BREBE|nr:hypothetical protein AB432_022395 [Brevibacillus brevis]
MLASELSMTIFGWCNLTQKIFKGYYRYNKSVNKLFEMIQVQRVIFLSLLRILKLFNGHFE